MSSDEILIDSMSWARLIVDLAAAWTHDPGASAHIANPLPDVGLGIAVGYRIFNRALEGAATEEIAKVIDESRTKLGPWREGEGPKSETELGISAFFQQLARYYDGVAWRPPRKSVSVQYAVDAMLEAALPDDGRPARLDTPLDDVDAAPVDSPDTRSLVNAPGVTVTLTRESEKRVKATKGDYVAFVKGPSRVKLFLLVAAQPFQEHDWLALQKAWSAADADVPENWAMPPSWDTLKRNGRRIRKDLGELGCYWHQTPQSARWAPPKPSD